MAVSLHPQCQSGSSECSGASEDDGHGTIASTTILLPAQLAVLEFSQKFVKIFLACILRPHINNKQHLLLDSTSAITHKSLANMNRVCSASMPKVVSVVNSLKAWPPVSLSVRHPNEDVDIPRISCSYSTEQKPQTVYGKLFKMRDSQFGWYHAFVFARLPSSATQQNSRREDASLAHRSWSLPDRAAVSSILSLEVV